MQRNDLMEHTGGHYSYLIMRVKKRRFSPKMGMIVIRFGVYNLFFLQKHYTTLQWGIGTMLLMEATGGEQYL